MVSGLTIIICARSGSKRLPEKHLLEINGKSLIEITVKQALEVVEKSNILLSTDDQRLLNIGRKNGIISIKRNKDLSSDKASKVDVFKYLSKIIKNDFIIDLDITAPLRDKNDILGVFKYLRAGSDIAFAACKMNSINPYFNMVEKKPNGYLGTVGEGKFVRTQDTPSVYLLNSIIGWQRKYLLNKNNLYETNSWSIHEMQEHKMFDIDKYMDFLIVKTLMENNL